MDQSAIDCCLFLQSGSCNNRGNCPYRHSASARQQKTCKFWLQGNCKQGATCIFKHPNPYSDKEGNPPSSIGNVTSAIGGIMLAGYFGYKLYEGARYLWGGESENSVDRQSTNDSPQASSSSSSHSSSQPSQPSQSSTPPPPQPPSSSLQDSLDDDRVDPFSCPITLQVMKDPVITPHGMCYERAAITDWLAKSNVCPVTRKPLALDQLITCYAMRNAISEYSPVNSLKMSSLSVSSPATVSLQPTSSPEASTVPPTTSNNNGNTNTSSTDNINSNINNINVQLPASPSQAQPRPKPIIIEVAPRIKDYVNVYTGHKLCEEDSSIMYPFENSLYITFPASTNYIFSRSTGYVVIQNLTDVDVTLISRERGASLFDPYNISGKQRGSYVLQGMTTQGFDYRGSFCIEVTADPNGRPIRLLVSEYAYSGGGKGAWLSMGTE